MSISLVLRMRRSPVMGPDETLNRTSMLGRNPFVQLGKLKDPLAWMQGEELITHLGRGYYK
ncbi:MAG: hypothetical protein WCF10_10635 [Polyangiales bacterium]